jgi:hypothetical protein
MPVPPRLFLGCGSVDVHVADIEEDDQRTGVDPKRNVIDGDRVNASGVLRESEKVPGEP